MRISDWSSDVCSSDLVAIHDARPMDWQRFDQHVSGAQRVNAVLDWLRRPADIRPAFVTLYFDIVDTAGHRFGPDSAEVNKAIGEVDERIGDLVAGLAAKRQPGHLLIDRKSTRLNSRH